jgi:hypothetical protein
MLPTTPNGVPAPEQAEPQLTDRTTAPKGVFQKNLKINTSPTVFRAHPNTFGTTNHCARQSGRRWLRLATPSSWPSRKQPNARRIPNAPAPQHQPLSQPVRSPTL